ncbi:MAG TPA: membrane protein insertion efficiency factor YidD, partial [Gammaproteobacteria bacterium]|nr:membrane protein insertion efficiency factor YidD [Gammaproteobacteria bacterium]
MRWITRWRQRLDRAVQRGLEALIGIYQLAISPWLAPRCRYTPTCSTYAREALRCHGPWRGGVYAVRRLMRCHPWGGFGYDPVPPARDC